jgi:segregation and condensation protein A
MAKKGEIDPWNIDVVDITDRFLKRLETAKELDLRVSGRVLLYAAILVRMKAEAITLEVIKEEDEEELIPDEVDFGIFSEDFDLEVESEDEEVFFNVLRAPRKRIRKISTLKDLIDELRKAEVVERRRRVRKKKERKQVSIDTLNIPHEESMEETILQIERELLDLLTKKDFVSFLSLVRGKRRDEVVDYFVSILHLAFRRKVEIHQEKIYEDILIKKFV